MWLGNMETKIMETLYHENLTMWAIAREKWKQKKWSNKTTNELVLRRVEKFMQN